MKITHECLTQERFNSDNLSCQSSPNRYGRPLHRNATGLDGKHKLWLVLRSQIIKTKIS